MSELIRNFSDGSFLEYDTGSFDKWCVYLTRPGKPRFPPLDVQYFNVALQLGEKYTNKVIYSDFVRLYEFVRKSRAISPEGFGLIESFMGKYQQSDIIRFEILYTILFAAMVAEEKKENTRLGAKIKRLGIHQILMDSPPLSVEEAASFSRGMSWQEINAECRIRGF